MEQRAQLGLGLVLAMLLAYAAAGARYKVIGDRLEPDLVPVSSTVIPLPVYRVGLGLEVAGKGAKGPRPDAPPPPLLTVHNQKKYYAQVEGAAAAASSPGTKIRKISKEEFQARPK